MPYITGLEQYQRVCRAERCEIGRHGSASDAAAHAATGGSPAARSARRGRRGFAAAVAFSGAAPRGGGARGAPLTLDMVRGRYQDGARRMGQNGLAGGAQQEPGEAPASA